jgi:hypothetical protein
MVTVLATMVGQRVFELSEPSPVDLTTMYVPLIKALSLQPHIQSRVYSNEKICGKTEGLTTYLINTKKLKS